eukprot:gene31676-54017_t
MALAPVQRVQGKHRAGRTEQARAAVSLRLDQLDALDQASTVANQRDADSIA